MNETNWYCIHTASGFEKLANDRLQARHIQTFYPRHSKIVTYFGHIKKPVERPYYPRYLFARCSIEDYLLAAFGQRKEVLSILDFGRGPAVVPEDMMAEMFPLFDESGLLKVDIAKKSQHRFVEGERIRVVSGCFSGYEGIFQREEKNRVWAMLAAIDDSTLHPVLQTKPVSVFLNEIEPAFA